MRKLLFLLFVFIFSAGAIGQDTPIAIETNLVTLNVAVTGRDGKYVRGLSKDDFIVMDERKAEDIVFFSSQDDALSIGIVYDMHEMNDHATDVLESMKRFTARLGPQDDYFVTIFNDKGSLTADFVPDQAQVRRHMADPEKNTPRALYDAIFAAGERVSRLKHPKKYLIVFTDGDDRNSSHSMKELRTRLRGINVPLYSLTFRENDMRNISYHDFARNGPRQTFVPGEATELDRSIVAEMSKSTGGQSFEASVRNRVYLAGLATKFLDEARNQYVIGFSPDARDARWHKVKVSIKPEKRAGLKVSSREGYLSRGE